MMRTRLSEALKGAMRRRDACAVSTLRLILAAIKDRDIAARTSGNPDGIPDGEIMELLHKMAAQREESVAFYEQGGRLEQAERERQEQEVIRSFLPEQLDENQTKEAVTEVLSEVGAESIKDMGKVMAELRARYAGRLDFGKASAVAKQHLS